MVKRTREQAQGLVEQARSELKNAGIDVNEVEVDNVPSKGRFDNLFSDSDDGTWVRAWVWVPR